MLTVRGSPGGLDGRFQEMSDQLRRMLRADGVAGLLATASLWALVSMALDWGLEMPRLARGLFLVLLVLLLLRSLLVLAGRLRREISMGALALAVEKSRPELEGQLLNAIGFQRELADAKLAGTSQLEVALLRRALAESERATRSIPFESGLNHRPFHLRILGTAAAAGALAAAAFAFPGASGLWLLRNILLRDDPWPRETQLSLDREKVVWHCARGESVQLLGWAKGKVPAEVTVWIRASSGSRRASFIPGANGRLAFTFPEVVEPFEFHLRGGDGRTNPRQVEVHDRPRILALSFAMGFPEYLGRAPETLENIAGDLVIPAGTTVAVRARADVPLRGGFAQWEKEPRVELSPAGPSAEEEKAVEHRLSPKASGGLDLAVVDKAWGLESRPPARARVDVRPDAPPRITLALKTKARVVTPVGSVGYKVEAKDDHGFSRLALESAVTASGADPRVEKTPFEGLPPRQAEIVREGVLELEHLSLEPGMRIALTAEGADDDGIAGPKPARSNSELLAVVGPEEFRDAMARARAVARRELEDALASEEKIARDFASAAGEGAEAPPSTESSPGDEKAASRNSGEKSVASRGAKGSRPESSAAAGSKSSESEGSPEGARPSAGESPPSAESSPSGSNPSTRSAPPSPSKLAGLSREQADSGRKVSRAAQELRDVAEALDQNRMMDRAERSRLDAEVLSPLDDLGEERFPRTAREIGDLAKSGDPGKERSRTAAELARIQESLRGVLDRLSDTEDFSDILHRLEGVLQLHRRAIEGTEKAGPPSRPAKQDPGKKKESP